MVGGQPFDKAGSNERRLVGAAVESDVGQAILQIGVACEVEVVGIERVIVDLQVESHLR